MRSLISLVISFEILRTYSLATVNEDALKHGDQKLTEELPGKKPGLPTVTIVQASSYPSLSGSGSCQLPTIVLSWDTESQPPPSSEAQENPLNPTTPTPDLCELPLVQVRWEPAKAQSRGDTPTNGARTSDACNLPPIKIRWDVPEPVPAPITLAAEGDPQTPTSTPEFCELPSIIASTNVRSDQECPPTSEDESSEKSASDDDLTPLKSSFTPNKPQDNWPSPATWYNNTISPMEYPSIVDVKVHGRDRFIVQPGNFIIRGVIISTKFVLAPGIQCKNCDYIVLVGSDGDGMGGIQYSATKIAFEDSRANPEDYIVLLELTRPIELGPNAQPAKLTDGGLKQGDRGVVVGSASSNLGRATNTRFLYCDRQVISEQEYNKRHSGFFGFQPRNFSGFFPATSIPKNSCNKGRNMVFFAQERVAGIFRDEMFVFDGEKSDGGFYFLNVERYYDIAFYRSWIKNHTGI